MMAFVKKRKNLTYQMLFLFYFSLSTCFSLKYLKCVKVFEGSIQELLNLWKRIFKNLKLPTYSNIKQALEVTWDGLDIINHAEKLLLHIYFLEFYNNHYEKVIHNKESQNIFVNLQPFGANNDIGTCLQIKFMSYHTRDAMPVGQNNVICKAL